MLAALQYRTPAIPHTECLGKRLNLNTSRTGETVSDRARPGRGPVSSNPVPLHDAGPRRAGGSGERQTERPTSDVNFHRRMPETPDEARYGAPAAGDSPSFARAAPNSAWKRSGTAGRLAVHHAWIARTCRRASGETSTRYRFNARDGGVEAGERQARRAPSSPSSAGRCGTGPPHA